MYYSISRDHEFLHKHYGRLKTYGNDVLSPLKGYLLKNKSDCVIISALLLGKCFRSWGGSIGLLANENFHPSLEIIAELLFIWVIANQKSVLPFCFYVTRSTAWHLKLNPSMQGRWMSLEILNLCSWYTEQLSLLAFPVYLWSHFLCVYLQWAGNQC